MTYYEGAAAETPILDTLKSIPADARMVYEFHPTASQNIPVGVIAGKAADEIERLRAERDGADATCSRGADMIRRLREELQRLRALLAEAVKVVKLVQAERDALRQVLDGFSGPPPTLLQWKMICGRAKEVASAIDKAREGA